MTTIANKDPPGDAGLGVLTLIFTTLQVRTVTPCTPPLLLSPSPIYYPPTPARARALEHTHVHTHTHSEKTVICKIKIQAQGLQ